MARISRIQSAVQERQHVYAGEAAIRSARQVACDTGQRAKGPRLVKGREPHCDVKKFSLVKRGRGQRDDAPLSRAHAHFSRPRINHAAVTRLIARGADDGRPRGGATARQGRLMARAHAHTLSRRARLIGQLIHILAGFSPQRRESREH
jgi:hypothetical protein